MKVHSGGAAGTYFYDYEANGDVMSLTSAVNGSTAAAYEYGPHGETIRSTGPLEQENRFRFSTKYEDNETYLLYYGQRYYNAKIGRWVNRDPAEERQGMTPYVFCNNQPINNIDYLGLSILDDFKTIGSSFGNMFSEYWENLCLSLTISGKVNIVDQKTERINGCAFACCPLPAAAIALIGEGILNKNFPVKYAKECGPGKSCCYDEWHTEPWQINWEFSIEVGPHGETGTVLLGGVDVTDALVALGVYQRTSVKTTCKFSGTAKGNGTVDLVTGECQ
jgi:RHS repeat-associated protein